MRRPTPLPPPAEPRPPTAAVEAPEQSLPPGAPAGGVGEVRLRDVWRAARARRRALRAEVRRFTVRQRRRRMRWLAVLGALVLLTAGTVAAAYGPIFAVQRIEVVGTSRLDAAAVASALEGQIGTPLALVDDSAVKAALVTFPLVESYSLEARPPNDLVVRVVERLPVGVFPSGAGFTVVDAAGVALSTAADAPADLPVLEIRGGVKSAAFRAAGQVLRSLPETLRARVASVTASSPDDVAFTLKETGTQVVWGSSERSAEKALVLETQLRVRPPEGVARYDVSSPEVVVAG